MRIACSSWSFHRSIPRDMALLEFPAWCGSQGITAIEVVDNQFPSFGSDYLDEFRRACRNAAVEITCFAITNDFTMPNADQRFAEVERVRQLLYDVAVPLKVPVMRVFMGTTDASPAGEQRALETFRSMVTDMEATGVSMALENHARMQTPPDTLGAIIAGVDNGLFGSCIDFASLPIEKRFAIIRALAPFAKLVHAKSYEFDQSGNEMTIDYKEALALLTEYAFDNTISIEFEGRDDPYQGVLKTKSLIERLWWYPSTGSQELAA